MIDLYLKIIKGAEMSLLYSAGKWNVPPAIAGYEPIGIFLSQGIFPSSRETARCPPCQVAAPYSQYSTGGPSHSPT